MTDDVQLLLRLMLMWCFEPVLVETEENLHGSEEKKRWTFIEGRNEVVLFWLKLPVVHYLKIVVMSIEEQVVLVVHFWLKSHRMPHSFHLGIISILHSIWKISFFFTIDGFSQMIVCIEKYWCRRCTLHKQMNIFLINQYSSSSSIFTKRL